MASSVQNTFRAAVIARLVDMGWTKFDCWEAPGSEREYTLVELVRTYRDMALVPPEFRLKRFPECTVHNYDVVLHTTHWWRDKRSLFGGKLAADASLFPSLANHYYLKGHPELTWARLRGHT